MLTAPSEAWPHERTATNDFSPTSQKAYPFTTENINSYIDGIDVNGARVAAICGSGDFGFSAVMLGAKSVDHVDSVISANFWAELKAVGLHKLSSLGDFKRFFGSAGPDRGVTGPDRLNPEVYGELRSGLSDQTRHYFDQLITPRGLAPYLRHGFLINKLTNVPKNMRMVPYLDDQVCYDAARASRERSRFHPTSMQNFLGVAAPESYDLIYLSNIDAYMPDSVYAALYGDAMRVARPGGEIIKTGFIHHTSPDARHRVERQANEHAERLKLDTAPKVFIGDYLPVSGAETYATVMTMNS